VSREVTLMHKFGGKKVGLRASVEKGKIVVEWPLNPPLRFWLKTGLPVGLRKGDTATWAVSDEDLAALRGATP
jgi:hypothetical protein